MNLASTRAKESTKTMSIAAKTKRDTPATGAAAATHFTILGTSVGNLGSLDHTPAASPHPRARTHDTNTKRDRNRFPDGGSPVGYSIISPQSPTRKIVIGRPGCPQHDPPWSTVGSYRVIFEKI